MSMTKEGQSRLTIRQVRHFSEAFKEKVVSDLDKGLTSIREVSTLYEVKPQTIYNWVYRYSVYHKKGSRLVVEMESEAKKTEQLSNRIAELERIIGQKQLTIDYLERLVTVTGEHYKVDVKKNFATLSSTGSMNTKANTDTP